MKAFRPPAPEKPNPLRAITLPRRMQITVALGKAVQAGAMITDEAQLLAKELCILTGGDPNQIVPAGELKDKMTAGGITCLPALPHGWRGFPMWMLIAAEARWGAKARHDAPLQNRSKRRT